MSLFKRQLGSIESLFKSLPIYFKRNLSFHEACIYCALEPEDLKKFTKDGTIPFYRSKSKEIFFKRRELKRWLRHPYHLESVEQRLNIALHLEKRDAAEILKHELMDSQDVMHLLKISKRTLQRMRKKRTLPHYKLQNKTYYRVSDLQDLLDENYVPAKSHTHGTK